MKKSLDKQTIHWCEVSSSPLQAVCCADHEHCCPHDYTCNMQTGTCEKKNLNVLGHIVPQSKVERLEPRGPEDAADVPCDSTGEFQCSKRDTCCKLSATEWACCPSPRVCSHVTHHQQSMISFMATAKKSWKYVITLPNVCYKMGKLNKNLNYRWTLSLENVSLNMEVFSSVFSFR